MADERRRGGGPKSQSGRETCSRNAIKHGGRSKATRILPNEDPEEFERIRTGWLKEYEPEGHMEQTLVKNLIESEWMLERARRNRWSAEARAVGEGKEPHEWTPEEAHQVELMQRYLTTAERSFYRAFNAVQGLRKDIMRKDTGIFRMEMARIKDQREITRLERNQSPPAQARNEKPAAKPQASKTKSGKPQIMDQWIDVEMIDGKPVISYYPSNEELWQEGQKMNPPPTMVYRRFHFVDAVPPEYAWTTSDPEAMERGGLGIQRMSLETWLRIIEDEKLTGKPGKCGGNLPKPETWGHCECKSCTANRERLLAMRQALP